jgi:hypothetical protein
MADVLAFNLTQAKSHAPRKFKRPDLSTKLKLLGVEVASFGDFFADRDGPKELPIKRGGGKKEGVIETKDRVKNLTEGPAPPPVKALTYKDPFQQVYKKFLFTMDGKYLLGGMMIGDTKDYVKLVPMVKNQKVLEMPPSELIIGASKGDDEGGDDLWVAFNRNARAYMLTLQQGRRYPNLLMSQCHQRRCCQSHQGRHLQEYRRSQILHQSRDRLRRMYASGNINLQRNYEVHG